MAVSRPTGWQPPAGTLAGESLLDGGAGLLAAGPGGHTKIGAGHKPRPYDEHGRYTGPKCGSIPIDGGPVRLFAVEADDTPDGEEPGGEEPPSEDAGAEPQAEPEEATAETAQELEGAQDLARRDKYQFQWWACSLVNAQPNGGKKKGADGGIDGLIFFQDDAAGTAKRIVVSVKGGDKVQVPMIRDLAHVVEREKASIGLFVSLSKPTEPMRKEAASVGFYECPHNKKGYPKIQLLTIEGLLSGHERAQYLDLSQGAVTFKKAPKEKGPKTRQAKLL